MRKHCFAKRRQYVWCVKLRHVAGVKLFILSLSFFVCKMDIIIVFVLKDC